MSRRANVIDSEAFRPLIEAAKTAFGSDIIYAVQMTNNARTIQHKRAVWRTKRDLREGEEIALRLCARTDTFVCDNKSPCGVGQCKFAQGDLALVNVVSVNGDTPRPQEWSAGPYNLEDAFETLLKMRLKAGYRFA